MVPKTEQKFLEWSTKRIAKKEILFPAPQTEAKQVPHYLLLSLHLGVA